MVADNTFCYTQGFPNGVNLGKGAGKFGQNDQKLHENYKIGILGSKQRGDMGGQTSFLGSGRILPSPHPPNLDTFNYCTLLALLMMMVMIMMVLARVMAASHGLAMEMDLILGDGINSKSGHGVSNIKGVSEPSPTMLHTMNIPLLLQ